MDTEVLQQVCLGGLPELAAGVVTFVVTIASLVANIVKKDTVLGKVVNLLAINLTVGKK